MNIQDKLIRSNTKTFNKILNVVKQMPKTLKHNEPAIEIIPDYRRINNFIKTHNLTDKYPVKELERWHMVLTSSCRKGRSDFAEAHNLNIEEDMLTIPEFFELVKGSWGSNVIELVEAYMRDAENK